MLGSFAFAFNAVVPILSLMALGYGLKRSGMFREDTLKEMNSFVFRYGLSVMMFCNIYSLENLSDIPLQLMLFTLGSIILLTLLYIAVARAVTGRRDRQGVIIQSGFRSNFAVIGAALASSLCGAEGQLLATGIQAPGIIYFNVAAVLCLTACAGGGRRVSLRDICRCIVTNPLIIGLFSGVVCLAAREFLPRNEQGALLFSLSGSLPFLYAPLNSLAEMATPLVLIVIGAQTDFHAAAGMKREIAAGVVLRLIVTPTLGFLMAFTAQHFGFLTLSPAVVSVLLAFYGSPVAVAGAVMADSMGCDGELARQHVVWTNTISMVTLFLWIVLFRQTGLL